MRAKFMAVDPHCHWCGVELKEYHEETWNKNHKFHDDQATIDHLYDRWESDKRRDAWKNHDHTAYVLSCHRCNQKRNQERQKKISKKAVSIRSMLGQQRKILLDKRPRPQVFRGLETLIEEK